MSGRRWVRQGRGPSAWTLEHRGRTEASLQWQGWAEAFRLTFAGENWTVDVTGAWTRRIVVKEAGLQRFAGTLVGYGADLTGHPNGPLHWRRVSRWRAAYELQAEDGRVLASFQVRRREARIHVETGLPDAIPLLAVGLVAHLTASSEAIVPALLSGARSAAAG